MNFFKKQMLILVLIPGLQSITIQASELPDITPVKFTTENIPTIIKQGFKVLQQENPTLPTALNFIRDRYEEHATTIDDLTMQKIQTTNINAHDKAIRDAENFIVDHMRDTLLTTLNIAIDNHIDIYSSTDPRFNGAVFTYLRDTAPLIWFKQDLDQSYLLHTAANAGNLSVVQLLIEQAKVNVNAKNIQGEIPLKYALNDSSSLEIVQMLIDAGAHPNIQNSVGQAPLHFAAKANAIRAAEILLAAGAHPNIQNILGDTPLHQTASYQLIYLIEQLINPNPITFAEILIDAGAHPNIQNILGETPLHFAARHNVMLAAQILIDAGADKTITTSQGKTPFDLATSDVMRDLLRP